MSYFVVDGVHDLPLVPHEQELRRSEHVTSRMHLELERAEREAAPVGRHQRVDLAGAAREDLDRLVGGEDAAVLSDLVDVRVRDERLIVPPIRIAPQDRSGEMDAAAVLELAVRLVEV